MYRIHLIKVPTTVDGLFPYSHYNDQYHDPFLQINIFNNKVVVNCKDLFKLKPNVQQYRKNRIDIYIPYDSAVQIANEIEGIAGRGTLAGPALSSPEDYRRGPQTLPIITQSRKIMFSSANVTIAGYQITQTDGRVFIDTEEPNEGHIEMKGPEIHLGIELKNCSISGQKNHDLVTKMNVPENELRVNNEQNPIETARREVCIVFDIPNARSLAATLQSFASRE